MGSKLLWTAVAIFIISLAFPIPAVAVVAAIFALIGIILMWLDK